MNFSGSYVLSMDARTDLEEGSEKETSTKDAMQDVAREEKPRAEVSRQ